MTAAELKAIREKMDLTQNELADFLSEASYTVAGWEAGTEPVSASAERLLLAVDNYVNVAKGGKLQRSARR